MEISELLARSDIPPDLRDAIVVEIAERKRIEQALKREKEFLAHVLNAVADPIFVKDVNHRWTILNDACCRMMGYPRSELIGKTDRDFFPPEQVDVFWATDDEVFLTGKENTNEERHTDANGCERIIVTKKSLFHDPRTGDPILVGVIRDCTASKQAEVQLTAALEQLRTLSNCDGLTQLANRRHFLALAEHQWRIATRTGQGLLLLFADMDNLKTINDELGHAEGDLALIEVANLLRAVFRDSDAIARMGGDEFVVLMTGSGSGPLKSAERLQEALRQRNAAHPDRLPLALSVGMAYSAPHSPTPLTELIARADQAMYEVKRQRRCRSASGARMPLPSLQADPPVATGSVTGRAS